MTGAGAARLLAAVLVAGSGCSSDLPGGDGADGGADAVPPDAVDPVPRDLDGRITINEFMAANAVTVLDGAGVASDWVELYNPTDQDLSLQGYALTDDLAVPAKGVLGAGVVIPARGHLVIWLTGTPGGPATHLDFRLRREDGELGLARPDGSYIDRLGYGTQEVDFSAARTPDGSDLWQIEWHPTPGAANRDGAGRPMGLDTGDGPPEQVPEAGDLSERFLGYDVMPEVGVVVAPEHAASLESAPFTYVPAQLIFEGRTYGPVGLRLKGQNSFQPFSQKPSMRINVDEYVENARFFGLKDLTLNNMDNDFSMMHERLAYFVARQVGIPASRCNHALVTVNGQFYGLYANVETVKKQMISRWFNDATGSLFEGTDVDFVDRYIPAFELEAGPDDRSLLSGLAGALTLTSPAQALAAAGAYVDLAQFRRYWAMSAVIGQFDALPYSVPGDDFLVYADPTTGRLTFLPWGMDETFYSGQFDVLQTHSVLARRCQESPLCRQAFVDEVWEVLAATERMGLAAERVRVIDQIAPHVALDTRKPYTDDEVVSYQTSLYWFIASRRTHLGAMLPPPSD